jgi:type I restriction enzyme R subunit
MAEVIAASAAVSVEDLDNVPFSEHGGVDGIVRDLGSGAGSLIETLNRELTA